MKCQIGAAFFLSVIFCCSGDKARVLNFKDKLRYNDCDDVSRSGRYNESGSYMLYLNSSTPVEVYCNFEALGSTKSLIMVQKYGRTSFVRGWLEYEHGFGSAGDFWLGLRRMKALTDTGHHVLTVTLQDWNNQLKVLQYNYFFLGSASERYKLHIGGYQSYHVLPDDFSHNNEKPFSTIDRPDTHLCALHQKGGWWYNYCTYTLPTGHYYRGGPYTPSGKFYDGIYYKDWLGYGYSLKYIKMELSRY